MVAVALGMRRCNVGIRHAYRINPSHGEGGRYAAGCLWGGVGDLAEDRAVQNYSECVLGRVPIMCLPYSFGVAG